MDELTSEFLVETNESLEALDLDFIQLEQNPDDAAIIGNIFRVMHTIKGTCGFLGLSRLESVAHAGENIMDKLRDGAFKATPEIISLILEANDRIKELIEHLEETESEPEGDDSDLINRLNACAESGVVAGGSVEAAPAAAESVEEMPSEEPELKTPDLDGEIDFEPVLASYASEGEEEAPAEEAAAEEDSGLKTPDLDGEIDFDPVPASYASDAVAEPKENTPATIDIPEETKKEAVEEGLKTADADAKKPAAAAGQSIRVNIDVLEDLMQMVGELVLTRNQLLQMLRGQETTEFSAPLQRLNHITTDLQEGVMKTRMQPIGNAWAKFPRLIRDLALELNKKIELQMVGADTDLDRQLLDSIKDPLTHMVRNSADHGIELPEARVAAGKPETGTVTLSAYHEGGHIIIKISDDGKGLDPDKIKAKAVANGMLTEEEVKTVSNKQLYQFIYKPGFSTAEKVTSVSGRGVGMDVVVSNIQKIGGTVELNSEPGKGSDFMIKIPLTLAIMPVLIVQSGKEQFAIPQIRVLEIVRAARPGASVSAKENTDNIDYFIETLNDCPVLRLRGKLLPLLSLSKILQIPPVENPDADNDNMVAEGVREPFIVVCEVGSQNIGILVDKVFHTEEIVVKPVSSLLKHVEVYSGCTILGDGRVIMIVDTNGLLKRSGIEDMHDSNMSDEKQESENETDITSFLTFKGWRNAPCAVPLELVARLEEIDMKTVEWSGNERVVQYRGALMRLVLPDGSIEFPEDGIREVIVFVDGKRIMGLLVEEVCDIVRQEMELQSLVGKNGVLGSLVVEGLATDLIDVSYYFSHAFADWLGHGDAERLGADGNTLPNKKQRILLVDDSPFFRKFMTPVLVVADYDVVTVESAAQALSLMKSSKEPFDLIVTDIDMPEMNGVEFVKHCKATEEFSHLPFVALTSHNESDFQEDPKDIGFSGFVSKSDRDNLINTISSVLASQEAA